MSSIAGAARKVLLVEDNPGDAELIRDLLDTRNGESPAVVHVATMAEAMAALRPKETDAVLLDLRLPDASGVGCVNALLRRDPDIPIIVLTGLDDEQVAVECLAAGAQDYLCKVEVATQTSAARSAMRSRVRGSDPSGAGQTRSSRGSPRSSARRATRS